MSTGDLALLVTIIGAVWQIVRERKRPALDQSTIDQSNIKAALELRAEMRAENMALKDEITKLRAQYADLSARFEEVERELERYKIGVGLLMGQLIDNDLRPTWTPPGVKES